LDSEGELAGAEKLLRLTLLASDLVEAVLDERWPAIISARIQAVSGWRSVLWAKASADLR